MSELWSAVLRREPLPWPVIDAHAHMGPYSRFFIDDPSPTSVLAVMDACGVDRLVFSAHRGIELDATEGNLETRAAIEEHPDRFAGWFVVNPHQDPAGELARWGDDPAFVGIKLHPDLHDYPITGPAYRGVWEWSARTGKPLLIHSWSGSPFDDPVRIAEAANRYAGALALVGHCGGVPAGFEASIEAALGAPGLLLETCGSNMTGAWVSRFVREVGADRVLFGSDVPFLDLRYQLAKVAALQLAEDDLRAVLGGNAARVLGLPLGPID